MIKCSKCNGIPSENDVMGWKCNSCGKTYKTSKTQLHNVLMKKKENSEQTFIKCPVCMRSLDDDNETIVWKCSCGSLNRGKLKDFAEEVENAQKVKLVKCPECGMKILNDSRLCSYCGYLLENETGRKKNLIKCPECGKENISNSAEVCPHCGYGIKEYIKNKTIEKDISNNHILEHSSTHKKSIAFNKKNIGIGCAGVIVLIVVVLFGIKIITYNNAVKYYEMEEWEMAIEKFEELGNFSDSEELLQKAKLELASVDYELGVYAYNIGDFATSIYLLEEVKSLYPSYIGLDEQLKLTRFMNDLQGIWESTKINIQVEGFRARLKDYDCNSYADYCEITPYTDDDGYFVIRVVGESGNRTWELKYKEASCIIQV